MLIIYLFKIKSGGIIHLWHVIESFIGLVKQITTKFWIYIQK